jgi:hypothetical protein
VEAGADLTVGMAGLTTVIPLPRPEETSVAAMHWRLPEGSMAASAEVGSFTAVARITAAEDTTAQGLDSASASIRLTAMRLPCAILQGSMTSTVSGKSIRVAPFRTGIKD